MVMQITVRSEIGKAEQYSIALPKQLSLTSHEATIEWAKKIQKSAKLRAPRWTTHLANNISVKAPRTGRVEVWSDAYYAGYQEFGYRPHFVSFLKHPILLEWQRQKYGEQNKNIDKDIPKGTGKKGHFFVKKYKPYLGPAIQANLGKLPGVFRKAIEDANKRSKR